MDEAPPINKRLHHCNLECVAIQKWIFLSLGSNDGGNLWVIGSDVQRKKIWFFFVSQKVGGRREKEEEISFSCV